MAQRIWLDATLEELPEEDGVASDAHPHLHLQSDAHPVPSESVPVLPLPTAAHPHPHAVEAALLTLTGTRPPELFSPALCSTTATPRLRDPSLSSSSAISPPPVATASAPTTPAPQPSFLPRSKRTSDSSRARLSNNSQELISSLIDSLATIAGPAHHHFEGLPGPYPASSPPTSPPLRQSSFSYSSTHDDGHGEPLDPEDAAEAPVIRTSKPPSGLSQVTARRTSKSGSLRGFILSSRRSSASLTGQQSLDDDANSVVAVSRDISRDSSRRASSTGIDGSPTRQGRVRSLVYFPSKERLRPQEKPKEAETGKQVTVQGLSLDRRPEPPRRYSSATGRSIRKHSLKTPGPISIVPYSANNSAPPSATFAGLSPPLTPASPRSPLAFPHTGPDSSPDEGKSYFGSIGKRSALDSSGRVQPTVPPANKALGLVEKNAVPHRRSSLRLSNSSPRTSMQIPMSIQDTAIGNGENAVASKPAVAAEKALPSPPVPEKQAPPDEPAANEKAKTILEDDNDTNKRGGRKVDSGIDKSLGGEEDVLRRIQELKAQKEQRDRELARTHLALPSEGREASLDSTLSSVRSFETASVGAKSTSTGGSHETQGASPQQQRRSQLAAHYSKDGTPILSPDKAHKLLGLSAASTPASREGGGSQSGSSGPDKTRLRTNGSNEENEAEPLTPTALPIDYSLIMQRLDGKGAPSKIRKAETPVAQTLADRPSGERSNLSDPSVKQLPPHPVGGRSAAARRKTKSMYPSTQASSRSASPDLSKPEVPSKDSVDDGDNSNT